MSSPERSTLVRWDFDRTGDHDCWDVPRERLGSVRGGSVWLHLGPLTNDPATVASVRHQTMGDQHAWFHVVLKAGVRIPPLDTTLLASPRGLALPAATATQVRMRVLNRSRLTDFFVQWRTGDEPWGGGHGPLYLVVPEQASRVALLADHGEWQEIVCHLDVPADVVIDQIAILGSLNSMSGDIWVDWVEIGDGPPPPEPFRPDLVSDRVVPRIQLPGIDQDGFDDAFRVFDEALIVEVPLYGMTHPVLSAGVTYRKAGWWLADSGIHLDGTKWADQRFAEGVLLGFADLQDANPDGHLDPIGHLGTRGQPAEVSQFPAIFDSAIAVARRTTDPAVRRRIYRLMSRNLDWWLSPVKRDVGSGLVTAFGEESYGDMTYHPEAGLQVFAPVDTNVMVAVGALHAAGLADALGESAAAERYRQAAADITAAIEELLWDDELGVYLNYDLRERSRRGGLLVSMFQPLRLAISPDRQSRLIERMLDPNEFDWGRHPLTTRSMRDPRFVLDGDLVAGNALGLEGNIWTLFNTLAIRGLEATGRHDLAAELCWSTIRDFHGNYREYLRPITAVGAGSERFSWAASHYVAAIIDHLFGISVDRLTDRLTVTPRIPRALAGQDIAIEGLRLPADGESRLSLRVSRSAGRTRFDLRVDGELPTTELCIGLAGGETVVVPLAPRVDVETADPG